ncbi:MAG: hypothetical protein M3440_05415, partial [Chloroflexota bacterium]|nr:hypothetical protein [Chloroflexota bacterium]
YSIVYDGANPDGAVSPGVTKARAMEDSGELDQNTAQRLERRYNIALPRAAGRRFYTPGRTNGMGNVRDQIREEAAEVGAELTEEEQAAQTAAAEAAAVAAAESEGMPTPVTPDPEATTVEDPDAAVVDAEAVEEVEAGEEEAEQSRSKVPAAVRTRLNARFKDSGITVGENTERALTALGDEIVALREQRKVLRHHVNTLERDAEDGQEYRKTLIDEAVTNVVRSQNPADPKPEQAERYRKMLQDQPIDEIRGVRDDFAAAAKRNLGTGRASADLDPDTGVVPARDDTDRYVGM